MAFGAQLVTVRTAPARQVVWAGGGKVGLANRDLVNPVYLGPDEGFSAASQAVAVIDPLGALPLDGDQDVWALTQSGTAVINAIPGALGFQPSPAQVAEQEIALGIPAQIAAAIATGNPLGTPGGVPLLNSSSLLDSLSGKVLTHGSQYSSAGLAVTKPSYDIVILTEIAAGSAAPWLQLELAWFDQALGFSFAEEHWYLPCTTAGVNVFGGRGVTKGDQLIVTLTNLDTAASVTVSYGITQHSRIAARDDLRSLAWNGMAGFTPQNSDLRANVLAMWNSVVNAGTTSSFVLPLFAGLTQWSLTEAGQPARVILSLPAERAALGAGVTNNAYYDSGPIAAGMQWDAMITLPRSAVEISLTNTGGANQAYVLGVVAQEY